MEGSRRGEPLVDNAGGPRLTDVEHHLRSMITGEPVVTQEGVRRTHRGVQVSASRARISEDGPPGRAAQRLHCFHVALCTTGRATHHDHTALPVEQRYERIQRAGSKRR